MRRKWTGLVLGLTLGALASGCEGGEKDAYLETMLYLRPERAQEVSVELRESEDFACVYPENEEGVWNLIARPDGKLTSLLDGQEYTRLFCEKWEEDRVEMTEGFVVKREDTASFLEETLSSLGFLPGEYQDFIVWWLPRLQENPYNLIAFYTGESGTLSIVPEPDSFVEVRMVYKALDRPVTVTEPVLRAAERRGFSAVQWSGMEVKD